MNYTNENIPSWPGVMVMLFIVIIILFGSKPNNYPDTSNYERDQALSDPCDFMSQGGYSVNC